MCFYSNLSHKRGRSLVQNSQLSLSLHVQFCRQYICTHVRLLGPCFKTDRMEPLHQHLIVTVLVSVAITSRPQSPTDFKGQAITTPKGLPSYPVFIHRQLMLLTSEYETRHSSSSSYASLRSTQKFHFHNTQVPQQK